MTVYTFNGKVIRKSEAGRTYKYALVKLSEETGNVVEVISMSTNEKRLEAEYNRLVNRWCKNVMKHYTYGEGWCEVDDEKAWRRDCNRMDYYISCEVVEVEAKFA